MAHSTDCRDSSCESVESDDQSVSWVSDWHAPDEAEDVDHEEVTDGELSAEGAWVSSFLTALQQIIGYTVPFKLDVEENI